MSNPSDRILALMYHGLDPGDGRYANADPAAMAYVLSKSTFSQHLEILHQSGRRILSPSVLHNPLKANLTSPVLLTFDDGMASDYDAAFPLLHAQRFGAFFFITTAEVGRPGRVSWVQLREMASAGMAIGSHGHSHRLLSALSPAEQTAELETSRKLLEDNLGQPIGSLSLPGGRRNRHTFAIAQACGYETVFTSEPSVHPRLLPSGLRTVGRVPIRATWTASCFQDFLQNEDRSLRAMRRIYVLKSMAQSLLGPALYTRLHRSISGTRQR